MFNELGMDVLLLKYNNHRRASVYVMAVATKNKWKWERFFHTSGRYKGRRKLSFITKEGDAGSRAVKNSLWASAINCLVSRLKNRNCSSGGSKHFRKSVNN